MPSAAELKADAGLKPNADLSLGIAVQSKTAVEATVYLLLSVRMALKTALRKTRGLWQ